jgi:RNA polymerase sigma-70 factor (ECF subfamily)
MEDHPTPSDHTLQVQRLFVQHQQVVLYYVMTIEPNLGDAQDIVQETFLTVSRKAGTYAQGTNFPAWACTVARYQALQFQRTRARAAARLDDDVMEMLYGEDGARPEILEPRTRALKEIGRASCRERV